MPIKRFEDLECWQEARALANAVYQLVKTNQLGREFQLRDQITSAAISVMNNIAEGFDSGSQAELMRFLSYSRRSASEVQTCLYVALDQELISASAFREVYAQAEKARKIVDGFRRYLRTNGRIALHGRTGERA